MNLKNVVNYSHNDQKKKHIPEDLTLQIVYTPFHYIFILISVFTYL